MLATSRRVVPSPVRPSNSSILELPVEKPAKGSVRYFRLGCAAAPGWVLKPDRPLAFMYLTEPGTTVRALALGRIAILGTLETRSSSGSVALGAGLTAEPAAAAAGAAEAASAFSLLNSFS